MENQNRIQGSIKENAPIFRLKVAFQSQNEFLHYLSSKIKLLKNLNLICPVSLTVISAVMFNILKSYNISKLEPNSSKTLKEHAIFDYIFRADHNPSLIILRPWLKTLINLDLSLECLFDVMWFLMSSTSKQIC